MGVFNHYWGLIATSPGAQTVQLKRGALGWKLTVKRTGDRWGTYAIHLHHSNGPEEPIWGYLQISRSLAYVDAEAERLWWLAGLAIAPLVEAYRRQQQFGADVVHELRTPLANLLAVVEAERGAIAKAPTSVLPTALIGSWVRAGIYWN